MSTAAPASQARTAAHQRFLARARARDEPTRTRTVRNNYAQRLRGAWDRIETALRTGIEDRDAFGLATGREALQPTPPRRRDFRFTRDSDKIEAFQEWLDTQTDREILDAFGGENRHIRRAYKRGVTDADTELRVANVVTQTGQASAVMQLPVHRRQLQALYTRNFGALTGMTEATANQMRRVLAEELAVGSGPREVARQLSDRIDAVGRTRATVIARTEVMHSHNRARAVEWQRHDVDQVGILIAPDACPQCQALKAGEPYTIDDAPALLPQHPNCRCSLFIWTGS